MAYSRYQQVNFGSIYADLATVGYALYNADGTLNTARTTSGVAQRGSGTGNYGATVSYADDFVGEIRWDTGGGSPVYSSDDVNPADSAGFDAIMVNGISYGRVMRYLAAVMLGKQQDNAYHATSAFYDVGDTLHLSPLVTSVNTATARTPTLY